jgi:hypothetical protein
MTDDEDIYYPNLEPDDLYTFKDTNFRSIKRLPGMEDKAPKIQWGGRYKEWPIERRLKYAEGLAASMNHAADVLQKERNRLVEIAEHQERQLKGKTRNLAAQGDMLQNEMNHHNSKQQELYELIVELQKTIKQQKKRIKELEGGANS